MIIKWEEFPALIDLITSTDFKIIDFRISAVVPALISTNLGERKFSPEGTKINPVLHTVILSIYNYVILKIIVNIMIIVI